MVHVADLDAVGLEELGEVFSHLFGEGRDEDTFAPFGPHVDLRNEVVDLAVDRFDRDHRIEQAGRADDLFDDLRAALPFKISRSSRGEDDLVHVRVELVKIQRTVVERARETEPELDEGLLSRAVSAVHTPDLRDGDVGLVDEQQEVVREVVHQSVWCGAGFPAGQDSRIVLDAGAEAGLPEHLHVVLGPLLDALRLDEFALALEELHLVPHLREDLLDGGVHDFRVDDIVGGRVNGSMLQDAVDLSGQSVDLADAVDLIAKVLDADGVLGLTRGEDLHGIAPDPELGADEVDVVSLVVELDQLSEQCVPRVLLTGPQRDDHVFVVDGRSDGVDAGH